MREGEKGREKDDGFSVVGVINGCICANKLMKCQPCQLLSRYQMSNFIFFFTWWCCHCKWRARQVKASRQCLIQSTHHPTHPRPTRPISTPYHQHTHLAQLPHSLLTLIIILMPRLMDTYIIKKFRRLALTKAQHCHHALLFTFLGGIFERFKQLPCGCFCARSKLTVR